FPSINGIGVEQFLAPIIITGTVQNYVICLCHSTSIICRALIIVWVARWGLYDARDRSVYPSKLRCDTAPEIFSRDDIHDFSTSLSTAHCTLAIRCTAS